MFSNFAIDIHNVWKNWYTVGLINKDPKKFPSMKDGRLCEREKSFQIERLC